MTINNGSLLGLFGQKQSSTDVAMGNIYAALMASAQAKAAASGVSSSVTTSIAAQNQRVPTPPWASSSPALRQDALVKSALAGRPFVDETGVAIDVSGKSPDYGKLFTVYQALNALDGIAAQAQSKTITSLQLDQLKSAFSRGLSEIGKYVDGLSFDNLQLASGQTGYAQTTTAGVKVPSYNYTGPVIYTGDPSQPVPAFSGTVQFSVNVDSLVNGPATVNFDLSEMGATPRTLDNVVAYLNGKMAAAGVTSTFSYKTEASGPNTVTVGGKTVTLPQGPSSYALTIRGTPIESLSFGASATADAVYVAQAATQTVKTTTSTPVMGTQTTTVANVTTTTSGSQVTTTTVQQQLLKFQTDQADGGIAPPDAQGRPGDPLGVPGRAWSATLQAAVSSASAVATAPDGSVYVLGAVDGSVSGQAIKGAQDVALMKYDSAGNLVFTRTLGAASTASGYALAVSAAGDVAVTGSVTGSLDVGDGGADAGNSPTTSDSFVTVFDSSGEETWTQRLGALGADQANAVAFGSDGSVYVAGKASSPMPGASAGFGGSDAYLTSFSATGAHQFTQQFGTTGADSASSIAVDGSTVYTGSVENGHVVVRSFDVTTATAPVAGAVRDLGDLGGGNLAGVAMNGGQLVVAGTARNASFGTGAAQVDAMSGGADVFVASLDPGLSGPGDTLAWYGGSGDETATALAVANGQIYVAGRTATDLPGTSPIGTQDGFLARIDPTTGQAGWTERFSGPGGSVVPSAIAVQSGGASVLDRLGLPAGDLNTSDPSDLIVSATALRAGDQFRISANGGTAQTVTIAANDTLQTLEQKIVRASGFRAHVTVSSSGGVEQLRITPASTLSELLLSEGPAGRDALAALGLKAGVIENTPDPTDPHSRPLSGLDLTSALNLDSADAIATAKTLLDQALSTVRVAYQNLATRGLPKPANNSASGPIPQYLQNQISNYQAALNRLTGAG